jgi:Cation/multidrug efflux pump
LSAFAINLIESIIIVIAILMLTMGIRSGNLMGICLVITVMGTFLILEIQGGMVQRVSVGAFILAMGMLVDNAIVIIDGILTDLQSGKPREEALTAIGRKTAMPLLGATFIAILAFYPIYLSPDTAGVYVRDLFVVFSGFFAVELGISTYLRADYGRSDAEENAGKEKRGALSEHLVPHAELLSLLGVASSSDYRRWCNRIADCQFLRLQTHTSGLFPGYELQSVVY